VNFEQVILLLGKRDYPTDGVADYCDQLRRAGAARGLSFETVQIPWAEKGWRLALAELHESASGWSGRWVFMQYTTLAWSNHGFPLRAPLVLETLRKCGARPGVVLHDFAPLEGRGIIGGIREMCQLRVLRRLYAWSDLAIFTVPVKKISWLPLHRGKAVFIPVGANSPEPPSSEKPGDRGKLTVAVYGVTGSSQILPEVTDIAFALKQASKGDRPIQLLVFGRNSREAEPSLRAALSDTNIEIEVLGLLSPEQVTEAFARSDVLLFVRGHISSRRGSAIAAIACGLPVVCYSGPDTDWPITQAGILAVPLGDRQALAGALENVLADPRFRKALSDRSREAHAKYFSWSAITANFAAAIGHVSSTVETQRAGGLPDEVRAT
jgi:glycosyltransferase involved in cell wall biosynthesis